MNDISAAKVLSLTDSIVDGRDRGLLPHNIRYKQGADGTTKISASLKGVRAGISTIDFCSAKSRTIRETIGVHAGFDDRLIQCDDVPSHRSLGRRHLRNSTRHTIALLQIAKSLWSGCVTRLAMQHRMQLTLSASRKWLASSFATLGRSICFGAMD